MPVGLLLYRHVYLLVYLRQSKQYKIELDGEPKMPIFIGFRKG